MTEEEFKALPFAVQQYIVTVQLLRGEVKPGLKPFLDINQLMVEQRALLQDPDVQKYLEEEKAKAQNR